MHLHSGRVHQISQDLRCLEVGWHCTSCEEHVKHAVNELPGIVDAQASYEEGKAVVTFDKTKADPEEIKAAIDATGYKVTGYQLAENLSH